MLNPLDFYSFLVLIFTRMRFEDRGLITSAGEFERDIAIMNLVIIA